MAKKPINNPKNAFSKMSEQDYKAFEQLSIDIINLFEESIG